VLLIPTFDITTYKLPIDDKTLDGFRNMMASGITKPWSEVPGLRNKYFTIGPDEMSKGAGFYVFKTKKECEDY